MAVATVGDVTNTNHYVFAKSSQQQEGGGTPQTQTHDIRKHTHAHTLIRTLGCARLSTLNMNVGVSSNGRALCTCASRSGSVSFQSRLNALLSSSLSSLSHRWPPSARHPLTSALRCSRVVAKLLSMRMFTCDVLSATTTTGVC